ncbi:MAG: hypothetical protein AAFQ82_16325 [Myxococcota bacterium]
MRASHLIFTTAILFASALVAAREAPPKRAQRGPSKIETRIRAEVVRPMNRLFDRRNMFSRARTVRPKRVVTTLAAQIDREGRSFVPFTIDSGKTPRKFAKRAPAPRHVLEGCYYPGDDTVYVGLDDGAVPARVHPQLTKSPKDTEVDRSRCAARNSALSAL